jgi:Methyltransferase domain
MNLKQAIKPFVPKPLRAWRQERPSEMQQLSDSIKPLHPRTCSVCNYRGFFTHFGRPPRVDARCPSCGSLERHRLFWLWFKGDKSKLEEPILHFAPEELLEQKFRGLYKKYSTADLFKEKDLKLNIEKIDLPSDSVNTVICNHVLEHVSDKQALAEIFRILSTSGRLVVSVPIVEGWEHTYENDSIKEPSLRELHFGQSDHVRYYGRDFRSRLREAGFEKIEEITAEGQDVVDYGLWRGEKFFVCSKG